MSDNRRGELKDGIWNVHETLDISGVKLIESGPLGVVGRIRTMTLVSAPDLDIDTDFKFAILDTNGGNIIYQDTANDDALQNVLNFYQGNVCIPIQASACIRVTCNTTQGSKAPFEFILLGD